MVPVVNTGAVTVPSSATANPVMIAASAISMARVRTSPRAVAASDNASTDAFTAVVRCVAVTLSVVSRTTAADAVSPDQLSSRSPVLADAARTVASTARLRSVTCAAATAREAGCHARSRVSPTRIYALPDNPASRVRNSVSTMS